MAKPLSSLTQLLLLGRKAHGISHTISELGNCSLSTRIILPNQSSILIKSDAEGIFSYYWEISLAVDEIVVFGWDSLQACAYFVSTSLDQASWNKLLE